MKQKRILIICILLVACGFSQTSNEDQSLNLVATDTSNPSTFTDVPTPLPPPSSTPKPTANPLRPPTSTPDIPPHLLIETCLGQIAYFTEMEEDALYEAIFQDIFQTFPIFAEIGQPDDFFLEAFSSFYPSPSPDGQQIAFTAGISSGGDSFINYGIFIVKAGGTEVRRLVPGRAAVELLLRSNVGGYGLTEERMNEILKSLGLAPWAFNPVWSPDGQKIAFIFGFGDSAGYLYVINADGSGLVPLGGGKIRSGATWSWSQSSLQIVFNAAQYGYDFNDIYNVNADGSELTRLTNEQAYYESPIWTTNDQIVFVQNPEYTSGIREDADIYIMNVDGSGLVNLTTELETGAVDPVWLPESGQIYFRSYQDGGSEYYVVNPDGSGFAPVSSELWYSERPRWTQCYGP